MRNVKCRNCTALRNAWCEKVIDSPDPDMLRDCRYFCQKTRADAIRRMTDAELATAMLRLAGIGDQLNFCPCKPECIERLDTDDIPDEWCHACMVAWLGAPAEDGL